MSDNAPQKKKTKLNWLIISQLFWKEQIFFYFLTTLSAVINYVMDANVAEIIQKIIKKKLDKNIAFKFFNYDLFIFRERSNFFFFLAFYIFFYCLIVITHVYFAFYLANKISRFLKGRISQKLFQLRTYNKQQIMTNLDSDEKTFTYRVVHYPNQIYYLLLTFFFTFTGLWIAKKNETIGNNVLLGGFIGFIFVAVIGFIFNYFVYKKDLLLQKKSEKIKKEENVLINNRDLIIKKNFTSSYRDNYQQAVSHNYDLTDQRDWKFTLSLVIPSYSLIPYIEYIILPLFCLVSGKYDYISLSMLSKIYSQEKKMMDRLKDYPYYFSAKKRLNWLLSQPDRNDLQQNQLINELITNINFKKVSFAYQENKWVLKDLDWQFTLGRINHLTGKNGFGKSTIVNIIMGLYQPNKGRIVINNHYELNEINLTEWRKKIAYAEHNNLIENGLSTGQKQLADLNNLFASDNNKEIYIFDEADNALDENNKSNFRQKLEEISKDKLVILISH